MICKICGIEVKSYGSLAQHVNKTHNITSINYYLKYIGGVGCFNNNIEPEIISSVVNLQMITSLDNNIKNCKCDITKKQLLDMYYVR